MSLMLVGLAALLTSLPVQVLAQSSVPAEVQTNTFNSSFHLSKAQIALANLTDAQARDFEIVINSDQSQLANGGARQDAFYSPLSPSPVPTEPGVLLKSEDFTNISTFALPPNTALSRIIYTSTNLNGTVVPASAFILWPFSPRSFKTVTPPKSAPVVLWNHGTSGFFTDQAPSTHRSLWYDYNSVFTLAVDGYAVVAPDYAGLGYNHNLTGNSTVKHQYLASPASARDGLYGLQAARTAFPSRLSDQFVAFGHSQGGGVAWAVSEILAKTPELGAGYLGSIAASPTTSLFSSAASLIAPFVATGFDSVFPDFNASEWLTPLGLGRFQLFTQLQGSLNFGIKLFSLPGDTVKPGYNLTSQAKTYSNLSDVGFKPVKGPLLVIQGTEDPVISPSLTTSRVKQSCDLFPDNDLSLLLSNGTGHVPTLDSTRSIWSKWIADRFDGVSAPRQACGNTTTVDSFLPLQQYQATGSSVVQWAEAPQYSYQLSALGA